MDNAFDLRRQGDPQGVINDLLKQITRQAKEIHDCGVTIKDRDAEIVKLNKKITKLDTKPEVDIPFDPD